MNTNLISNNYSEDKNSEFNYSVALQHSSVSETSAETFKCADSVYLQNGLTQITKTDTDHLSILPAREDINEKSLNLARSISQKTKDFKSKYYIDAAHLTSNQEKKPGIKYFMQIAE
ncbi:MAG: hypothetical protein N3B13_07375, partial [Deltaproteobacteria bacterium]|nr:hypothetical protein [Deltaproteobacteria bacterium]